MSSRPWILALAVCGCIGVPATLAVSEDCRKAAFAIEWAAKVHAMRLWNNDPRHKAYVDAHRLKTADHSRATAALKARMLKSLDTLSCVYPSGAPSEAARPGESVTLSAEDIAASLRSFAASGDQDVIPSQSDLALERQDLPLYDNPERVYQGDAGYPSAPGFGGWGGYVGGFPGGNGGAGTKPSGPSTPIAPTPEPGALILVASGMFGAAAILRRRR